MGFYAQLVAHTQAAREGLVMISAIERSLIGQITRETYLAFLREAYHHVRHTVPLLTKTRAALTPSYAWLHGPLTEYIEEESGHDDWILDDLRACGADVDALRSGSPGPATELMVAYAYDTIARVNPLGFFGMVYVLEGTSVALALRAADAIQKALGLPDEAFRYLRSHGTLDVEHTAHFAQLMDAIHEPTDQRAIVHAAHMFFRLYGDVFRALPLPEAAAT
ncbi:MAG TPA: iron-containing redox enzyme family protein [Burkholderiaceae bacterium]|nr:iron-containing redox enzyme family protein [Burkholderiaceae bacterium]